MDCLICSSFSGTGKKFSNHLTKHGMSSKEYSWRFIFKLDSEPSCILCKNEVRYSAFKFKKYCKNHSKIAESEAGKVGGSIKKTWNKGKTHEEDSRIKQLFGKDNPFFGKQHSSKTIEDMSSSLKLTEEELRKRIRESLSSQFWKEDFLYSDYETWQTPIGVVCSKCGSKDKRCLMDLERGTRCHSCFGVGSVQEDEINEFVKSLGFKTERNSRKIIAPKEIDIFVEEKKLGIEFHGLYWHSGGRSGVTERGQHRNKMLNMNLKGYSLIQIFSDEWENKREICESMISQRLGCVKQKLNARDLTFKQVDKTLSKYFFEETHISGNTRNFIAFGLFDRQEKLICAMSFRKPIQKKYINTAELARFSTKLNTLVNGGASKLMKHSEQKLKEMGFEQILSYSDLRFGSGNVYSKLGFNRMQDTGIDYFYTDGKSRFDRFKFRASDGKTEKEIADLNGVRKVFGCGHAVYLKKI